jgi:hypothetical protein
VVGVTLLAFVITLSVAVSSTAARMRREAAQAREESMRPKKQPLLTAEDLALSPEDFLLPPMDQPASKMRYTPFRPRITRWNADLAAKYWVEPREIAAEIVESINDQNMQRLFQDVP